MFRPNPSILLLAKFTFKPEQAQSIQECFSKLKASSLTHTANNMLTTISNSSTFTLHRFRIDYLDNHFATIRNKNKAYESPYLKYLKGFMD